MSCHAANCAIDQPEAQLILSIIHSVGSLFRIRQAATSCRLARRRPLNRSFLARAMSTTQQGAKTHPPHILDVFSSSKYPAFIKHEPRMVLGEGIQYRPSDKTLHCWLRHGKSLKWSMESELTLAILDRP